MFDTLSIDCRCCIECLDVVVGPTNSEECERQLKAHVATLELLRANSDELLILHVCDDKAVGGADRVVVVNIVRLLELGVHRESLDEEIVGDNVVVEDLDLGIVLAFSLQHKIELTVVIEISEAKEGGGVSS